MRDELGRNTSLNKVELLLGIAIGIATLLGLYNSYVILPYRVEKLEQAATEMRSEIRFLRDENRDINENLIRMDERLKTIQRALKIPTAEP
jgi:wobble nucleotide-excising tRNase